MSVLGFWARGRSAARMTVIASTMALGGCGTFDSLYMNDPAYTEGQKGQGHVDAAKDQPTFNISTDCIPAHLDAQQACTVPTLRRINDAGVSAEGTYLRNRLQDYLISRSDQMCEKHRAGILAGQATTNLTLNTLTTGLSATAAIVVAPATNILAALGAMSSAVHSHVNADLYQKYVAPAIVRKINDTRAEKLKEILAKRSKPARDTAKPSVATSVRDYTPEAAIGDVEQYNQYCSFAWAISNLTDPTAKFSDSSLGIQQRIDLLRKQWLANKDQIAKLDGNDPDVQRLKDLNGDISRQLMVLQQQLFSAPATVDPKPQTTDQ